MKNTKNVRWCILALAICSAFFVMNAQPTIPPCADDLVLRGTIEPTAFAIKNNAAFSITMPEVVEILRIKRPYLRLGEKTVVVRVTDEEWQKLVAAYPKDALQNADSATELVFMAPKSK